MEATPSGLPAHLSGNSPAGLVENEPVAQFEIGSHRNFVYLVMDWSAKKAAIVDPQKDLGPLLSALEKHGFELTGVFLTHSHHDHIAGVPELMRKFPSVPVHVHEAEARRLPKELRSQPSIQLIEDGDLITVGSLVVHVIHTPGHSAGECSYYFYAGKPDTRLYLLTGDTIFIRDCGRTDLDSGSTEQMFDSIQKVKALPPFTVILPGHHYAPECASTVGKESAESKPFLCQSVAELEALP